VAEAGVLLVKVEYLKNNYGNLFACVNAGTYNSVPRPAIYEEAYHEIVNASRVNGGKKDKITVAGHLCETGDVFWRGTADALSGAGANSGHLDGRCLLPEHGFQFQPA